MHRLTTGLLIMYIIVVLFTAIGWVSNIYQIVSGSYALEYLIVKIIGIFLPPLGAVLGYVGLF